MNTPNFLTRLNPEYKKLLLMEARPEEQAHFLFNQYDEQALKIAEDCRDNCTDFGDPEAEKYWREVCACLSPLMIVH